MEAKKRGRKQNVSKTNAADDIYHFEYKLRNALSLLDRAKITRHDRQKILEFIDLLKALSQQGAGVKIHQGQRQGHPNLQKRFEGLREPWIVASKTSGTNEATWSVSQDPCSRPTFV